MVEKSRVCFVLTCIPSSDAWTICVGVYFVYYSGACDACEVGSASSGSSYLENYLELFGGSRKGQLLFAGIANSLKAVGMTLLVGIPICLMSAYTLSRMEFKGEKIHPESSFDHDGHSCHGDDHSVVSDFCCQTVVG